MRSRVNVRGRGRVSCNVRGRDGGRYRGREVKVMLEVDMEVEEM